MDSLASIDAVFSGVTNILTTAWNVYLMPALYSVSRRCCVRKPTKPVVLPLLASDAMIEEPAVKSIGAYSFT